MVNMVPGWIDFPARSHIIFLVKDIGASPNCAIGALKQACVMYFIDDTET